MGLLDDIKGLFGSRRLEAFDTDRHLDAANEESLARGVSTLVTGARAWIALADAARIFSPSQDIRYAFGELDEDGRHRLKQFADNYHLQVDVMPDGRVYFTKVDKPDRGWEL